MESTNKEIYDLSSVVEVLQDMMFFDFIFRLKKNVKNKELKNFISMILIDVIPVLVHEASIFLDRTGLVKKEDFFLPGIEKRINEIRQRSLKFQITQSSKKEGINHKMGLDFNNEVFDMNIVLNGNELLDINYELYFKNLEKDAPLYEGLFTLPGDIMKMIIEEGSRDFHDHLNKYFEIVAEEVELIYSLKRYSYASKNFFYKTSKLERFEKEFILYNYRLVKSLSFLDEIPQLDLTVSKENYKLNFNLAKIKYKAMIIVKLGEELQLHKSVLYDEILHSFEQNIINPKFYRLNRKLRNNIHYSKIIKLSEEEMKIIKKNSLKLLKN